MSEATRIAIISVGGAILGGVITGIFTYLAARSQFAAMVLGTSRREWMNSLRDKVAEYGMCLTQHARFVVLKNRLIAENKPLPIEIAREIQENTKSITLLGMSINLMLDPQDPTHQELTHCIFSAYGGTQAIGGLEDTQAIAALHARIAEAAQRVLKAEWEKMRKGR